MLAAVPDVAVPPRILVADDSPFMRRMLCDALRDAGFDVVAEAADGDEALARYRALRPDAMTLDLAMPGMDGIGVLQALRSHGQVSLPVVVVSDFSAAHGARAVEALAEGAFDLVAKPRDGVASAPFLTALSDKVAAAVLAGTGAAPVRLAPSRPDATARPAPGGGGRVVLIAISTGGPRALAALLPALPSPLGAGGMIIQHMPAGFTTSLALRLDRSCALTVAEARGGEPLAPDTLLLAPGGRHLRVAADGTVALTDDAAIGGLRPRADLTIADAARTFGERLVLVVMTGMGKDGLEGAHAVRAAGGRVLAEAESSCTVYGMPRAVAEAGLVDVVAPLDGLAAAIAAEVAA
jgi:two-component system chemotaxis response regulator CheB